MNWFPRKFRKYRFAAWVCTAALVMIVCLIPIRLATAYASAPQPQAILTLGGGSEREAFTAEFAQLHPDLPIWVSSGIAQTEAEAIFQQADIALERVHLDYRAADTVTNFTSLVKTFQHQGIQHVYLITSDFHMRRARAIATVVFGIEGIAFTPIEVPSSEPEESSLRVARDVGRSILWIVTGRTGASLNPKLARDSTGGVFNN